MSYQSYSKRDPIKNYFPVPNELYHLGLSYGAIAVYGYLLRIENRETFRCHASYKTIGKAVRMSANTVAKYVRELEDRRLIRTEPTTIVRARDGRKMNGSLLYNIRPIQEAMDCFLKRQMQTMEETVERQRVQAKLLLLREPQEPLCAAFAGEVSPGPTATETGQFGPVSEGLRGTREKAKEKAGKSLITSCRSAERPTRSGTNQAARPKSSFRG